MQNHNLTEHIILCLKQLKIHYIVLLPQELVIIELLMLNEHFRSHEDIITYSNQTWYGGNLEIGTDYKRLNPQPEDGESTVQWINVIGNIQQVDGSGAYISNEVNAVVQKVIDLAQN